MVMKGHPRSMDGAENSFEPRGSFGRRDEGCVLGPKVWLFSKAVVRAAHRLGGEGAHLALSKASGRKDI